MNPTFSRDFSIGNRQGYVRNQVSLLDRSCPIPNYLFRNHIMGIKESPPADRDRVSSVEKRRELAVRCQRRFVHRFFEYNPWLFLEMIFNQITCRVLRT